MHAHKLEFVSWYDLEKFADQGKPLPALLWLGHPNNPTGAAFAHIEWLVRHHPDTLFIIDEAFIEFTLNIASLIPLLKECANLVILRSLTKTFSIPGLRLGYALASRPVIQKLQSVKMPWSVNAMALAAGHFIFDRYPSISPPVERLLQDKEQFLLQLQSHPILTYESHTHYFLCETEQGNARELQQYLLDEHGIAIRNAANFRGLGPRHFRLASLSPHQNQLLINALKEWRLQCA
jgi:threonine-phosphate decarboxylase